MRLVAAVVRATFIWAIPVLVAVLLWSPLNGLFAGNPLQILLGLFLVLVVLASLVRGALDMSRDLLAGRYDSERATERLAQEDQPDPKVRRSRWLDLGLFTVSVLVTLVLLEVVFRLFLPQPLYAAQYTSWGWWHIPNTCVIHGADARTEGTVLRGTEFVTRLCYNSAGMRDVERTINKPADTKRILVLGDSYAEEIEVDYEHTVARLLEKALNADLAALPERPPAAAPATPAGPYDDILDPTTQAIWRTLVRESAAGARVLAAGVHFKGQELDRRIQFMRELGASFVDVRDEDYDRYHFRFDGHWNELGTARAAGIIHQQIVRDGLLVRDAALRRVEVLNAGMTAYSSCKFLRVYQEIGRRYSPDLIIVIWTASDSRNDADRDICHLGPDGQLQIGERTYSGAQHVVRSIRSWIKTNSHFLTWVSDRVDGLPFMADLRRGFLQGQDDVRLLEGPGARP